MAEPIEVARRHDAAFNAQDVETRMAIETPDIETVMPGGMTLKGPEQVIQAVRSFWEALPDARIVVDRELAAGDTVVNEGWLTGTHTGVFRTPDGEIPPTGKQVSLRYAAVKRFREGRLVAEHLYFDRLELLQQLGG